MHKTHQLNLSLLLGFLSLIPNNSIRYTVLGLTAAITILCALHLKRPSTQLSQLEAAIQRTEDLLTEAKAQCMRHHLRFTEEWIRLIKRFASALHCRILETRGLTWSAYRQLTRDIAGCADDLERLRITVKLTMQFERQRNYTQDINETRSLLTAVRWPSNGHAH
ncbi:hypothetical protein DFH09DRAFT_264093 [Mycena vulgaris]|nr:hypothetical protein DFH09DRAFT_264093 [Mycena vulgaris]